MKLINGIKLSYIYLFIFISFLSSAFCDAQNCQNYSDQCNLADKSYSKGSISQGIKVLNGQLYSIVCMVYEGKENYISVCGEFDVGIINFKILNYETKEVLYDNSDDNFNQSLNLQVEITAKIIIQISAPDAKYSFTEGKCIGLLVAYKNVD